MRLDILAKALVIWVIILLAKLLLSYIPSTNFDIDKYKNNSFFLLMKDSEDAHNLLPENDYNQLIDIEFHFTRLSYTCNVTAPLLLVLIHSAPTNFEKRQTIRETWGQNQKDIKLLFIMGSITSQNVRAKLNRENSIHKDIIEGNFLDTYRNLTYKHTMALKYVVYHCPLAKYVLKTDDDTFVNMPLMKNFLITDMSPFGAKKLLMCSVIYKSKTIRSFRSKWRISFEEYDQKFYPTYCLGWSILYSPDVILSFYTETQRSNYFWIDDVHITGIIADKLNFVGHINVKPMILQRREMISLINATHKYRPFLFGCADMNENEIRYLWKYVVSNPVPKSIREN